MFVDKFRHNLRVCECDKHFIVIVWHNVFFEKYKMYAQFGMMKWKDYVFTFEFSFIIHFC